MTEHRIQLRRAWDRDDAGPATRLDLPIRWGRDVIPSRISRSFNRPRVHDGSEVVHLEFASTPGLRSVVLNDRDLGWPRDGVDPWIVALADLRPFGNRLVLTLDGLAAMRADEWGRIALVIRGSSPVDVPVAAPDR